MAYPDGRVIPFRQSAWDSALAVPGGAVAFQLAQIPIRTAELEAVVDWIFRASHRNTQVPVLGRLDLSRIGAFGHSLGGMASAELCRRDRRIRACMNQDAEYHGVPWVEGGDLRQPFAFMATNHSLYGSANSDPALPDSELAGIGMTRAGYDSLMQQRASAQDSGLAAVRGGAVRIRLQTPDFTHRSFMELRLLEAPTDSAVQVHWRNLRLATRLTLGFFNRWLPRRCSELDRRPSPPQWASVPFPRLPLGNPR